MRIFLDANILFSAAKTNGAVSMLVQWLLEKGHECWIDDFVIAEARRNLAAKWPQALQTFEALLGTLRVASQRGAAVMSHEDIDWLPSKDRPVLSAAIQLQCDALVSGDRTHFGRGYGRMFGGVTIHSPRSIAELMLRLES